MNLNLQYSYLTDKNYLIICDSQGGLGDLSCGMKVANDLHQRLKIPVSHIVLASNNLEGIKHFNSAHFTVEQSAVEKIKQIIEKYRIDFQIMVPTDTSSACHKIKEQLPALALLEYGFFLKKESGINFAYQSLGLNKDKKEIGILIDHSLKEWGFSKESDVSFNRLNHLQYLTDQLKKAILGQKNLKEFDQSSCLYMSYAPKNSLNHFINRVIEINFNNQKKLVFIFSGLTNLSSTELSIEQSVKQIKIINLNSPDSEKQNLNLLHATRKIKILIGSINSNDMHSLFKATEREILVTGDQSLSEAISANKNLIYIQSSHKSGLAQTLNEMGYPVYDCNKGSKFPCFSENHRFKLLNQQAVEQDYFYPMIELIDQQFKQFKPIEIDDSLKDVSDVEQLKTHIKFDKQYRLGRVQMNLLKMNREGQSPYFEDSIFDYEYEFGEDITILIKRKKTS